MLATAHGKARAGYVYDDRTGVSYEYPTGRYENWIMTGERFVYHDPDAPGHSGYIGAGIIGDIHQSGTDGRLVCDILDYVSFPATVPLKDPSTGTYFESDPTFWKTGNIYWSQGARPLALIVHESW